MRALACLLVALALLGCSNSPGQAPKIPVGLREAPTRPSLPKSLSDKCPVPDEVLRPRAAPVPVIRAYRKALLICSRKHQATVKLYRATR
jgi:hypothetical protein